MSTPSALRTALLLGFAAVTFFAFNQQAFAADTISAKVYQDTDGNGTVNRVRWTMDENVTACAYEAGDWTVNTASEMNWAITGISCTGSNAFLDITITSDTNETGSVTPPVISYANAGTAGSVTLTSGAMSAKASQTITDAAAPTIVSTTPVSAGVGVSITSDVVIAFSERMDPTFDEGTEFAVSPDPGSFTTTWSGDEMTVTLSFVNMLCGHAYSVTTDEAEIIASTGTVTTLVTTGPQDGDWSFTTGACGSGSSTPATVSSFSYDGAVCSLENTQSFSVTGSNIDAYLASDDQYFSDAEWVSNDIEGSDSFNVTFDDSTSTAYFALRSDTGAVTNVYSFDLTDWSSTCGTSDDSAGSDENSDDGSEDMPSDDTSSDDSSDIVPVAGVNPGDVIHSSTSSAVYYVTSTYTRRVFINEQSYFTWFDSFDGVKEVSASTLSALPLDGSMLPKAGVVLVKIQSSPVVYFLDDSSDEFSPELREIGDEATAIDLFGSNWADYVIDIEPTFFTKFDSGLEVDASEDLGIDVNDMKERESLHD
ncbi:MAG: hypothetical protein QG626_145 [Patescibacteria group bacterium]|nr:hypothetical protein [Patescibacteria group bacterium]